MDAETDSFKKRSMLIYSLVGLILGIAIGIVFAILSVVNFGFKGIPAVLFFPIVFGLGFAFLGFILSILPEKLKISLLSLIIIIIFGLGLFMLISYWRIGFVPSFIKAAGIGSMVSSIGKDLLNLWACMRGDVDNCIFFTMFEEPTIINKTESVQIDMKVYNDVIDENGDFDVTVELDVYNNVLDFVQIKPYCILEYDGLKQEIQPTQLEAFSQGNTFVFEKSSSKQTTAFHCQGHISDLPEIAVAKLTVVLQRPVLVSSYMQIRTMQHAKERVQEKSFMEQAAPYLFWISIPSSQPFDVGQYTMRLLLKQSDYDAKLKSIEWIRAIVQSNDIALYCDDFKQIKQNEVELTNIEDIRKYLVSKKNVETYSFNCKLDVLAASEKEQKALVKATTLYVVESKKTFTLKKF